MEGKNKIVFKKKFGQNFLSDKNLLNSIVSDAGVTKDDVVVEIGAGAGALTQALARQAKKVLAFEIDTSLKPVLEENLADFNNVEIIYEDFLQINEDFLSSKVDGDFKVVANLPYYITTPILTKLLELEHRPSTILVMVQKEVGERITARPGTSSYGYFSAFISNMAEAKIARQVNRKMFYPVPNVDSCTVLLLPKNKEVDRGFNQFLIKCFAMKRKTLVNNLEKGLMLNKQAAKNIVTLSGLSENVRADQLSADEIYKVYKNVK